jgi:hypothetical protein
VSKTGGKKWIPEIVYEEGSSHIPYIHVPDGEDDPGILFIFLSRQTGEYEPGEDGEEVPIVEMNLHQYADMSTLKAKLPGELYDQVRSALGLLPLKEAVERGKAITSHVRDEVETRTDVDRRRDEIQAAVEESLDRRSLQRGEA